MGKINVPTVSAPNNPRLSHLCVPRDGFSFPSTSQPGGRSDCSQTCSYSQESPSAHRYFCQWSEHNQKVLTGENSASLWSVLCYMKALDTFLLEFQTWDINRDWSGECYWMSAPYCRPTRAQALRTLLFTGFCISSATQTGCVLQAKFQKSKKSCGGVREREISRWN